MTEARWGGQGRSGANYRLMAGLVVGKWRFGGYPGVLVRFDGCPRFPYECPRFHRRKMVIRSVSRSSVAGFPQLPDFPRFCWVSWISPLAYEAKTCKGRGLG